MKKNKSALEKIALWLNGGSLPVILICLLAAFPGDLRAQSVVLPNFVDQKQRLVKPDLSGEGAIRFLTASDYPPFNFLDDRGVLTGFNIDLVRETCRELGVLNRCQVEALPFSELPDALREGRGDAIIAGLAIDSDHRDRFLFTHPYLRFPARFVTLKNGTIGEPISQTLQGKRVGVIARSAHAAMFEAFFPESTVVRFESLEKALTALKEKQVDTFFGDGVGLSFWLQSEGAADCCAFAGGPYLSDYFLGEGLAIAVLPERARLARAFDYALVQLVKKKTFSELLLRYFPVSAF